MTANNQQFFTRCPHCRTMFRVVSAISEASQGWVKCGRCKKVFDSEKNTIDPSAFIKAEETSGDKKNETEANESPTKQTAETPSNKPVIKQGSQSTPPQDKPTAKSIKQSSTTDTESKSSVESIQNQKPGEHIAFVESRESKKVEAGQLQVPLFKTKKEDSRTDEIIATPEPKTRHSAPIKIEKSPRKPTEFQHEEKIIPTPKPTVKPQQTEKPVTGDEQSTALFRPGKKSTVSTQQQLSVKAAKKRKEEKSQWTKSILAQAQSWKKEKNRFQSRRSYTGMLFAIGLLALLIWQVAIVNYTRLANYDFLSGPLNLTCAIFSCNQQQPANEHEFEILHANLRRHASAPGVITISANLINYSNSDKLLPNIRLDLTDANESVVASKIINLVDHPQYIDPTISQLAPGQDVKLKFDIDRPIRSAVGFEIRIIN